MYKTGVFKIFAVTALLLTVSVLSAFSQFVYEGKIKVSDIRTDKISDKLVVSFVLDYQSISLRENEYLQITPSLNVSGVKKELKPVTINGKSQHKYYERVKALTKAKPDAENDAYVLMFENRKRFNNKLSYVSELSSDNGIDALDLIIKTEECACNGKTARVFEESLSLRKTVTANIVTDRTPANPVKTDNNASGSNNLLMPELVRADYTIWYAPGKTSVGESGIDVDSDLFKSIMQLAGKLGLKNEKDLVDLILMLKKNNVDSIGILNAIQSKALTSDSKQVEAVKPVKPVETVKTLKAIEKTDNASKKDELISKQGNVSVYKSTSDSGSKFFVQLGAFRKKSNADRLYNKMIEIFPKTSIKVEDNYHKVRLGYYDSVEEAFENIRSVKWNDIYINKTK